MENVDIKKEKIKKSKRKYGNFYNKKNVTVQLDRDLIDKIKKKLNNQSVKSFIEELISSNV
jgi:uncharacterized protein (DUF4415 family)